MLVLGRLWKGFWQLADPKLWVASVVPLAVGSALAYNHGYRFSWYWVFVALGGLCLIEVAKNAANEFIDFVSGVDTAISADKRNPFSGGKKTIIDGLLAPAETLLICLFTLVAAGLVGLYIVFFREAAVLWVGLLGVFCALFYSLPPFSFNYRGWGELVVGLTYGPLVVSGAYLMLAHTLRPEVVLVSLPISFLIANVLWINQYPDYEADKQGGKYNWVVKLGKERGLRIHALLFIAAYAALLVLAVTYRNPWWLLGFVGTPLAWQAVAAARRYYNDVPQLLVSNAKTVVVFQLTGLCMVAAALASSR